MTAVNSHQAMGCSQGRTSASKHTTAMICGAVIWLAGWLVACGDNPDSEIGSLSSAEAPEVASAPAEDLLPSSPASIVLISIDTLRSDHVGAYGGPVATPHLDALADDGIVYERAYSHVPMTLPSHLSMLTGLLPPNHGVRDNIGYRPGTADLPYVPKLLQDAGYATAAAVSAYVMQGRSGLSLGFDVYADLSVDETPDSGGSSASDRRGAGGVQRPGDETLAAVRPWLAARESDGTPFFLFLHLFEPHTPYRPPSPFAERYGATSYAGEVAAADALVGELVAELRRLDLYDATAVLVLSDHGEGLGDHGEEEHGLLLYRESLQVPLILKLPSATAAGRRVTTPVGLVDVGPTLLQLADRKIPAVDGESLLRHLAEEPAPTEREDGIYAETYYPRLHFGWSELTSLVLGDLHYIEGPSAEGARAELYDLGQDPEERQDLISEERRSAADLRDRLAAMVTDPQPPGTVSAKDRQALAALGYVGHGTDPDASGPLPHPKDQLATVLQIQECLRSYQEGRLGAAAEACRLATEQHPRALDAWEHLARALLEQRRHEEALGALERSLELAAGRAPHLAVAAATLLLESQRLDDALALLQRESVLSPEDLSLRLYTTRTLVMTGRVEEALQQAENLVTERPDHADAVYLRGAVRIGRRDLEGAEADLRRALELSPTHTAALSDLATLLTHTGRRDEAADHYRRLLELRPGDPAAVEGLRRLGEPNRRSAPGATPGDPR